MTQGRPVQVPDLRHQLASQHLENIKLAEEVTGEKWMGHNWRKVAYDSFLSGFDAAMQRGHEELLAENEILHIAVIDHNMKVDQSASERKEANE